MRKNVTLCIILIVLGVSFLCGCADDYECDIYRWEYDSYTGMYGWDYYSWDVYSGRGASDAEDACEDDWGGSYDCRDCVPY